MKKFLKKPIIIVLAVMAIVVGGSKLSKSVMRSIDPPTDPPVSMILPK